MENAFPLKPENPGTVEKGKLSSKYNNNPCQLELLF